MGDPYDFDENPALNSDAPPFGSPEGQSPETINNVIREVMASVATLYRTFPWLNIIKAETLVRVSATQFTVTGIDVTAIFIKDRQLRLGGSGGPTTHGRITSSSFATNTTVNVVIDETAGVVPVGLNKAEVSLLTPVSGILLSSQMNPAALADLERGDNLIRDASFEQGDLTLFQIDNQGGGPWELTTDERSGANAIRYSASGQTGEARFYLNGSDRTLTIGQIQAQEDDVFLVRSFVKYVGTLPGVSKVKLGMEFYNENATLVGTSLGALFEPTTSYVGTSQVMVKAPADTVYGVPFLAVESGSPTGTTYYFDDLRCHRLQTAASLAAVASNATIDLTPDNLFFNVTGTTTITAITGGYHERRVTLKFADVLSVTDGATIKLAGGTFASTADSTLSLIYDLDAGIWYETGRSIA